MICFVGVLGVVFLLGLVVVLVWFDFVVVVFCLFNFFFSVDLIFVVDGVCECLVVCCVFFIVVLLFVGGKVLKGLLGKLFGEFGYESSNCVIVVYYVGLIEYLIIDESDVVDVEGLCVMGVLVIIVGIVMCDVVDWVWFVCVVLLVVGIE